MGLKSSGCKLKSFYMPDNISEIVKRVALAIFFLNSQLLLAKDGLKFVDDYRKIPPQPISSFLANTAHNNSINQNNEPSKKMVKPSGEGISVRVDDLIKIKDRVDWVLENADKSVNLLSWARKRPVLNNSKWEQGIEPKQEKDRNSADDRIASYSIKVQGDGTNLNIDPMMPASAQVAVDESKYFAGNNSDDIYQNQQEALLIKEGASGIFVEPENVIISEIGKKLKVIIDKSAVKNFPQIFVRDANILAWDSLNEEFISKKAGKTEIFFTVQDKLIIVPVIIDGTVDEPSSSLATLYSPAELTSLDYFSHLGSSLGDLSADAISKMPNDLNEQSYFENVDLVSNQQEALNQNKPKKESLPLLTVEMARQQAAQGIANEESRSKIVREMTPISYTNIVFQVIEDRSDEEHTKLYPAGGVSVRLIGTEFLATTDAAGMTGSVKVPQHSRLLVAVDDVSGRYQAGISEIVVDGARNGGKPEVARIKVIPKSMHETIMSLLGEVEEVDKSVGSACFDFVDEKGLAQQNIAIKLDIDKIAPVYFNKFGFIDSHLAATGPNGRACIFQVPSGPIALTIEDQQSQTSMTFPVNIFASRHMQQTISLDDSFILKTGLVASSTAAEQLMGGVALNHYRSLDWAELYTLGSNGGVFLPSEEGKVIANQSLGVINGRAFYIAQSPEFESTVYTVDENVSLDGHITPLIPQGFVEDMAIQANSEWFDDPTFGSVIVEHGRMQDQTFETGLTIVKLIDHTGLEVGSPYTIGQGVVTKSIFFNVPPGLYTVMVTTDKGIWLTTSTIMVYSETLSYLQTGSPLKLRVSDLQSS